MKLLTIFEAAAKHALERLAGSDPDRFRLTQEEAIRMKSVLEKKLIDWSKKYLHNLPGQFRNDRYIPERFVQVCEVNGKRLAAIIKPNSDSVLALNVVTFLGPEMNRHEHMTLKEFEDYFQYLIKPGLNKIGWLAYKGGQR